MFKIVRTVSSLLLTAALCSGGTVYAADNAVTSVTATSQQQKTLKGTVNSSKRYNKRCRNGFGW